MAEREALHLLACLRQVTRYRGQGFVVENKTVRKPRCVASAIGRRDHWADRYRAGSILPATIRPCRKIESRHRDSPQDCHAVLQCAASRYGLRRSGHHITRPAIGSGLSKIFIGAPRPSDSFCKQQRCRPRAGRFLGKLRCCWASQLRATTSLDGRRGGSGAGSGLIAAACTALGCRAPAFIAARPSGDSRLRLCADGHRRCGRLSHKNAKSFSTC